MNLNNSQKIIIAVHHFPPTFKGGAEWRAHRTAKWLQAHGYTVKVVCVESVDDANTSTLSWVDDTYDTISVRRLYLNMTDAPSPSKWEYNNTWIKNHFVQ